MPPRSLQLHPTGRPVADTVSDFLIQRFSEWSVRRIFGYPDDGINRIMGALERASDRMEFIQPRHEEMAAFMACGTPTSRGAP